MWTWLINAPSPAQAAPPPTATSWLPVHPPAPQRPTATATRVIGSPEIPPEPTKRLPTNSPTSTPSITATISPTLPPASPNETEQPANQISPNSEPASVDETPADEDPLPEEVLPTSTLTPVPPPTEAATPIPPSPTSPPQPTSLPVQVQAEVAAVTLDPEVVFDPEVGGSPPSTEQSATETEDSVTTTNLVEQELELVPSPATPVPWPPPAAPPPPLTLEQLTAIPTRLVIESVGIDSVVVPVGWYTAEQDGQLTSVWEVAEFAVGWHQNSALPSEQGNVVMSAHSNISGEVFRNLSEVSKGDKIVIYVDEQTVEYEITLTTIVKEAGESIETRQQNAKWIAPTNEAQLTLVTCWPYPYSTHRFIVVATPL